MSRRPNILIFMTDQEQAQVVLPHHPCRTPHADRLAAEGIHFTSCYTPTAHCCPARATFMTGLYPSGHGVYNNILNHAAIHTDLYTGVPTWSELLRHAGYSLKFSGKWHVTKHRDPQNCGWDELAANCLGGQHHGLDWAHWRERQAAGGDVARERQRGEIARPGWGPFRLYGQQPRREGQEHSFSPGDYQTVQTGLQGLEQATAGSDPWCVYIGTQGPHDPYIVPEKYATMYDPAEVSLPESWSDDLSDKPVVYQRQRRLWSQMTEDEHREAIAHYWGYCTMQDDLLGLALDRLERSGQADDTLVLFLSDHGDYGGAHGLWLKGVPAFDEAYRVPCIARWPNGIERPGRRVDDFVTLADFFPTFLEMAEAPARERCHGRSLTPFFRGERPDDWRETFCNQMNGIELYYTQRIVQTHDWKYVHNGFDWDELYDRRNDPTERHNLAPRPGQPRPESRELIRDLCARLWRFGEETNDITGNPYPSVALAPFGPMTGLE
ncbi:MAG: sulfatase-like hydrolase/transferase [Armatimonadetes bacterium]|nr:sulfatase-like hydrolase/transferase [Armatimonadota bacterium]